MAKSDKLYADGPALGRDEETGKVEVKKPTKPADNGNGGATGTEGMAAPLRHAHERREMHHRHIGEHMQMHHRHEMEHAAHESAGHGHKGALHERHEREMGEMHGRHVAEMKKMHDRHEKEGGGKAEK